MTVVSLITAVAVGLVLGGLARWFVPSCRRVPFWLPLATAVGAAVLGAVIVCLAGVPARSGYAEVILQVSLAGMALGAVAATAEQRPAADTYGKAGDPR